MIDNNPTILLVEDNEDDVFAMRRALKKGSISNPLQVVTDGRLAMDYLSGSGEFADRARHPLPFVVFLDLKMPYVDGFEVLSWIRRQPALQSLVVAVLTSSAEGRDENKTFELGANFFLTKPPTPDSLNGVFNSFETEIISRSS